MMTKKQAILVSCAASLLFGSVSLAAADYKKAVEVPDATKILKKDKLAPPKEWKMPKGCISNDPNVIAIGKFIFHNLNGKKAKDTPPPGLSKKQRKEGKTYKPGDKIPPKQYGNCVACHNIEGAVGAGNIGPDLHNYQKNFIDTKVRDYQYVYQQIADSRIHDKDSRMTINLTTGLFTPEEVCAITSYVVSEKK
jgi:sulfur-oxidizing protein SoxX